MPVCDRYNPDNVFLRFQLMEFPRSFVGLSTTLELDIEIDLTKSAYLKTLYENCLWKFEEARELSASHRAFTITTINEHTINITFKPINECISKARHKKNFDNRFVFDLRLIQVDGCRCCNNEFHAEIGRYYISGQFEYCTISHYPKILNFGEVIMNDKITKHIRIRNESKLITANLQYVRVTNFEVVPQKFTIPPNSSKRICVSIKPTCIKVANNLTFKIRNPHDFTDNNIHEEMMKNNDNYLTYSVKVDSKVIYDKNPKTVLVESLHKLYDKNPYYTYLGEELNTYFQRKMKGYNFLNVCKASHAKPPMNEKFCSGKDTCCNEILSVVKPENFCKIIRESITPYELFNIHFLPYFIDFGRIGLHTYGEHVFTIKNNTKYDVIITLHNDDCVLYTLDRLRTIIIKLKPFSETNLSIFCLGFVEGNYRGTFEYNIDRKYSRKHPYGLAVGTPTLMLKDKILKFGMVTTESFVTSVPIRIYNYFNISINFQWDGLYTDTPFEILPSCGSIPKHSSKICDVIYVCKPSKSKTYEIDFISQSKPPKIIPIELSIITRKLSIKFLQPAVLFKDIGLNVETIERVKFENSSREIALFYIVEPLIPGLRIEPMSGILRPKMIITFEVIVKISYVLEFSFDIVVKINNKENVILPVSGNVVEPKIIMHPKHLYISRVPCYMITYVPVTIQNTSTVKTIIQVLDTGDENMFDVYIAQGNEKQRVLEFFIEGGQSKTVFIKVYDIFRREYEMYIPFKINGLLGPPSSNTVSTELQYYINEFEKYYENNPKLKVKKVNKDISYCRISGVITVPWIEFSVNNFEIEYNPNGSNCLDFTMTNISRYYLHITILTSKLSPNFTLNLQTEENQSIINENNIKFGLDQKQTATFQLKFHPKGHGRFVAVAILFLDKHMAIPYYNLTFIGKKQTPLMIPDIHRIIFPPCYVGTNICRRLTLKLEGEYDMNDFSCSSKEELNLITNFINSEIIEEHHVTYTLLTVEINVCCQNTYARNLTLTFNHINGAVCEVEVSFTFTHCILTLHANFLVSPESNPYPYFPLNNQSELYDYMDTCSKFLEKWLFQQGFRRDLYPIIPDTFHTISSAITSQQGSSKTKGMNVSYMNFVKRIAGPLMKHIRKISVTGEDETFKTIQEIHGTYKEIINLLKYRGADLWLLQARFLLSYEQFVTYCENVTPKCNADIILTQELLSNINLFNRLNKQSWIDFILQSYKVFVMDSCFFECVCVSSQARDIEKILIDWYNEQIMLQHRNLRHRDRKVKILTNITTDLTDGIAFISAILNYCPFMKDHFAIFCETEDNTDKDAAIINNACLVIDAMNLLRLYFPLTSKDFFEPNFLQMLFLSIHFYVTLPMFQPKDVIKFNPPLLRSSTRHVCVSPASQESLIFNYVILNSSGNTFSVEKAAAGENGKKMLLNVKYIANFVHSENAILLVHGYNKTRIFDTYIVFLLHGEIGSLNPVKKCKVTGPLYRPNKVDVLVCSPFITSCLFTLSVTDDEPSIPVVFEEEAAKPKFYIRRLNLIDTEIQLNGMPKETGSEIQEQKVYLQIICLSTLTGNSWIWFRSEIGEFFIKITTQPRWDLAIDTLQVKVHSWPMDPCNCGEACECYRTTVLMIPHRNELMLKSLRCALLEHASSVMLDVFDRLIETTTGKIILGMLLEESGTNMADAAHILQNETTFRITSRTLLPRLDRVTLNQHTDAMLPLPITVPAQDKSEKFSITFTSECGMDIRTYRILFIEIGDIGESSNTD